MESAASEVWEVPAGSADRAAPGGPAGRVSFPREAAAEIREKALSWLPDEMRFGAIEKPERFRSYSAFLSDEDDCDGGAGELAPDGDAGDLDQAA